MKDFYLKKDVIALTRAVKIGNASKYVFGVDISPNLFERLAFDYCQKTTSTVKKDDKYICGIYHADGSILFFSRHTENQTSIVDTEPQLVKELLNKPFGITLSEQRCYHRKLKQCLSTRASISVPDSEVKSVKAGCDNYTIKRDTLFDQTVIIVVRNETSGLGLG